jgi:hypothetical protein
MNGVAHTCGGDNHKEIHLSLDYIKQVEPRAKPEISGVITHEVVHCFQYNGKGTCPSGLIEGIAGPFFSPLMADGFMIVPNNNQTTSACVLTSPHRIGILQRVRDGMPDTQQPPISLTGSNASEKTLFAA